jgi:hypothetical protein
MAASSSSLMSFHGTLEGYGVRGARTTRRLAAKTRQSRLTALLQRESAQVLLSSRASTSISASPPAATSIVASLFIMTPTPPATVSRRYGAPKTAFSRSLAGEETNSVLSFASRTWPSRSISAGSGSLRLMSITFEKSMCSSRYMIVPHWRIRNFITHGLPRLCPDRHVC